MGNRLKTIGIYCCSNGYGHFKRAIEVSKLLAPHNNIHIYCSLDQYNKFDPILNVKYNICSRENIKWEKVLNGNSQEVIEEYFEWIEFYSNTYSKHDIVISDNLAGILKYRKDALILGSFLWSDVFKAFLGDNKLTNFDRSLIRKYNPLLITNKYVETQSVKEYNNKKQFGFGAKLRNTKVGDIKYNLVNSSSLKYLNSYSQFIKNLKKTEKLVFTEDFSYINNTIMFARPGVGTITHCVENNIPLVALYDESDSQEILELAQIVEDLKLGFKQNVNKPFLKSKFYSITSNIDLVKKDSIEINGYSKIVNYINKL